MRFTLTHMPSWITSLKLPRFSTYLGKQYEMQLDGITKDDLIYQISEGRKLYILVMTLQDPTISGNNLSILIFRKFGTNIGRTIINEFRKSISFKYGNGISVLPLTDTYKIKRLNFANNYFIQGYPHRYVVFSDEKWFYR